MRRRFGERLRRRRPSRPTRPTVLICCEGGKTEPQYFSDLCRDRRVYSQVKIVPPEHGTHPKGVVECAVQYRAEAKWDRTPYDEAWCVFDMDSHSGVPGAFQKAEARGIGVAFSNPCFEIWYLLHFEYSTAERSGAEVRQRLREHVPDYDKSASVFHHLKGCLGTACSHAVRLREYHCAIRNPETANPSTSVDRLVVKLDELSRRAATGEVAREPEV